MDKLRLNEKNNIYTRIKEVENLLSRSQKTIERFKSLDNTEFNKKQIEKNQKSILDNNILLDSLKKRLVDVSSGDLDEELKNISTQAGKALKQQQILTDKKTTDKNEKKKKDKINLDKEYNTFRKKEGISEYAIQKETERFYKNCNSIPDYIHTNLNDMPNNKGYIWKGVYLYGKKPIERSNNNIIVTTMFEKCRDGILKIHEYTKTTYRVYEKVGKEQKRLVIDETRFLIK
jgi:hypothetical protein